MWLESDMFSTLDDAQLEAAIQPVASAIRAHLVDKWSAAVLEAAGGDGDAIEAAQLANMLRACNPALADAQVQQRWLRA